MQTDEVKSDSGTNATHPTYASIAAWRTEAIRRFGPNGLKWKFVCPACGHIQMPEDFRPYKRFGATAEDARYNCIGRFSGGKSWLNDGKDAVGPCDYTTGGLLDITPVTIGLENGRIAKSFAFASVP